MTDHPIIFSGPMVRALFEGRKSMTRRLRWTGRRAADGDGFRESPWARVRPGGRLWVRESLTHVTRDPVTDRPCSVHCYTASIPPGYESANPYEANYLFAGDGEPNLKPKSIPSIHMPRWASRLTLIVTASKIERLQDISEDDAAAEGAYQSFDQASRLMWTLDGEHYVSGENPKAYAFRMLWSVLHGNGSWDANPQVVALTFTVHKQNIDALPKAEAA